jgi:hypothetical protein
MTSDDRKGFDMALHVGDRVTVKHDAGTEQGTVVSTSDSNPMVTVRFSDGTVSAWYRSAIVAVADPFDIPKGE